MVQQYRSPNRLSPGLGVPLDIMLLTLGASLLAFLQIARPIHKPSGKVNAFVPNPATSGGLLITFATDQIRDGRELGSRTR